MMPGLSTARRRLLFGASLLATLFVAAGCEELLSEADPRVYGLQGAHDTRIINDQFDYGINVTFSVRNEGEAGVVVVTPRLSCSEGEWERRQTIPFGAGETRHFEYFFHEPTINAASIYYSVKVFP